MIVIDEILSVVSIAMDLAKKNQENDLVLTDEGFYYKKSEVKEGKKIRYCAASRVVNVLQKLNHY